jgi:RecA-family ATPase
MTFPPQVAYIDGLILEGLSVLGGKPKLGKSWFGLRGAVTIATGGIAFGNPGRAVTAAPVLYLALEDGPARIQDRLAHLLAPDEPWPNDLTVADRWPRFDAGGRDMLAEAVDQDGYRVVFVDTLGRVRSPRAGRGDAYLEDTEAIAAVHDLARERPGLAVVLIHHNRKADHPDDYIDALSGTTGITGAADHVAVLQRARGEADAVLRFTSRDAAEHDTAYSFSDGCWTELGAAAEYAQSKARRAALDALRTLGGTAGLSEIADEMGGTKQNTAKLLRGLETDGLVKQDGPRGPWNLVEMVDKVDGNPSGSTKSTESTTPGATSSLEGEW